MKDKKIKTINKVLSNIFCFVIWPLLSFLIIPLIMIIIQAKNSQIITDWVLQKRSIVSDFSDFWEVSSFYRNITILIIVSGSIVFLAFFNYKIWWEKIKNRITNQKEVNPNNWEYNQFTKEGNLKSFKKKFQPGQPNFSLGMFDINPKKQYLINNTDAHAIVLGISGSKKTEKIVLPNIWYNATLAHHLKPNMIITDPKRQILSRTGKMLIENGYNIKVFDFEDAKKSLYWNPLEQVWWTLHSKPKEQLDEFDYASAYDKIIEIVELLAWINKEDSMWESNAKNIIILILKFLLLYSLEDETFTLDFYNIPNITQTLSERYVKNGAWVKIAEKYKTKNRYWFEFFGEQKSMIDIVPETLSGILTNAINAVSSFSQNISIKKITSNITFSVKELIRDNSKPFAVFICFPDHKNIFDFLMSMLITQIYQESVDFANTLPKQKLKRMLQFYLEEFNSLYLPKIPDWMAISRSRNILFMLIIQSYEQLQKYSTKGRDYKTIKSQARLNFLLETNSDETLKSFSTALGEKIIKKETISESEKNKTVSVSEQKELIMSVSELKYKNPDMTIISTGGSKPIAIKLKPAYEYLPDQDYVHPNNLKDEAKKVEWDFIAMKKIVLKDQKESNQNTEQNEFFIRKEKLVLPKEVLKAKQEALDFIKNNKSLCSSFKQH
ncbi:type IV secretory system conjugative DNA transfer family protein [Mycoplasma capricolum subsp. capricolum]|uniref:type IV secretory system conjugative DNA transfer family protein n=1 Tax=Mycoplasma capricolum TaxID=2095 RepID=UPI0020C13CA5|nr:type IV secretory system conjugative DNA transfer family protein [Mycoplasma capricolum]MCK8461670.1 type IV secretory system conjugative DNA transfer family protein [Mycoplasma capricolum subsp. capricolum]